MGDKIGVIVAEQGGSPGYAYKLNVPAGSLALSGGEAILTPGKAPAAVAAGFAGTVSSAGNTLTFSAAADDTLCEVGSTVIAGGVTLHLVADAGDKQWTTAEASALAGGTAITSIQKKSGSFQDDAGNKRWVYFADGAAVQLSAAGAVQVFIDSDGSVSISNTISAGIPLTEAPETRAITAQEMRGEQLNNRGQLAELTNTLDSPAEGLNFIYCIETIGAGAVHLKADAGHAILMDDGSTQTLLDNGDKVSIVVPAIYNMLTIFARKNDAGTWYWHIIAGTGTTITDGGA